MINPRMRQRSAIGIAVSAFVAALGLAALAADSDRDEKPVAVNATQYADFMENEALDIQDLAEGAEIQRRLFNRLTPPGVALFQPMAPDLVPFVFKNFADSFLDGLLGEDKNSVAIYPLSLALDPETRETLVYNAAGNLIASIPSNESSHEWPEDADPARVTLRLDLLSAEDVEPFLYTGRRIAESGASQPTIRKRTARKSLGPSVFGFSGAQRMSNGNMRLTVSNGADVAEVYAYTVVHTSATVVVTYTNEQSNVVTNTNTVWTPVSPPFNGIASAWESLTTNLTLTNGVGMWEDVNLASLARTRFYAAAQAGDADLDGLSDGAEWYVNHTNPHHYDSDSDLLPDAWEVGWNLNPCASNSPSSDQDGDGLSDFNEYRYCTDPRQADTDGDGVGDGAEVAGQPPTNPNTPNTVYDPTNCSVFSLTVGDSSGSHSERWEFVIREAESNRVVIRHMDAGYGTPATNIYTLERGHYKGEVNWIATKAETPDYDWRALINNAVESGTYSGLGNTACFKVDDPDELLTRLTHGDELNLTRGREVDLRVPFSADCDIDIVQESTNVIFGSGSNVTLNVTSNSEADGDFTWDSEPAGISGTGRVLSFLPPTAPGSYTIYCRDSADPNCYDICMLDGPKVEMTRPDDKATQRYFHYYFNSASQGVCEVACKVSITPDTQDIRNQLQNKVLWSIDPISGSTLSWQNGGTGPGKGIYYGGEWEEKAIYTTLPANNGEFGIKDTTVTLTGFGCSQDGNTKIFYARNEKNHPGQGAGQTPNWYFYWSQTGASFGTYEYYGPGMDGNGRSYAAFIGGQWRARIGNAVESGTIVVNGITYSKGIDHFAFDTRHEEQHRTDFIALWGASSDKDPANDLDVDYLPDDQEANLVPNHPYSPNLSATYPDTWGYGSGWRDAEDYALLRQSYPTPGDYDAVDWSYPGNQWNPAQGDPAYTEY